MKQKLKYLILILALLLLAGLVSMWIVAAGQRAAGAEPKALPETTNDAVAWITPDGMLYIQVERGSELLYFDSFNIAALYRVAQSPRLQWQDRWEFRRE